MTVAPGSTPPAGSVTAPAIDPVDACGSGFCAASVATRASAGQRRIRIRTIGSNHYRIETVNFPLATALQVLPSPVKSMSLPGTESFIILMDLLLSVLTRLLGGNTISTCDFLSLLLNSLNIVN